MRSLHFFLLNRFDFFGSRKFWPSYLLPKNQRGQGLIEYLIIVALMGVATIAIVRVMGQAVAGRFASVTYALQGDARKIKPETIDTNDYKKRDLGNFFQGAGHGSSRGQGGGSSSPSAGPSDAGSDGGD